MQARIVQGDQLGFNALVYSQPDQRLLDYFQESINTASQKIGNVASSFVNNAREMYDKYNSASVINAAKALISTLDSHLNPDVILSLNEANIYRAMPIMQEYIMAQPQMWELNRTQMCSSFDGTYYNRQPDITSYEDNVRYQEAMSGMIQFSKDSDIAYFETFSSSEMDDLHYMDQFSILNTWNTVANLIAIDTDPSSPDGDTL